MNRYNCDVNFLVMIKKAVLITVLAVSMALINKALNVKNKVVDYNLQLLQVQKTAQKRQVVYYVMPEVADVVKIDVAMSTDDFVVANDAVIRKLIDNKERDLAISKMSFKDRIKLFYKKFKGE